MTPPCYNCGEPAVVHWLRRPTEDEVAVQVAIEEQRRAEVDAATGMPLSDYPPLPTAADMVIAVYACAEHPIHLDLAARVHASDCAPEPHHLPDCNCSPESAPEPQRMAKRETVTLPTGWVVSAPGQGAA